MTTRDFDQELLDNSGRKYAYDFDTEVMHGYMVDSFNSFFIPGNILELGSYKGAFTKRLFPFFQDITCVEAADSAIEMARAEHGARVKFIKSTFEDLNLLTRYNNIVLTHVLEHLDNPVAILRRINDEWLAPGGRLFLVCPNAKAPSRQIAVKMGLISHCEEVTSSEAEHGHRITYTLDTLERDARAGGLNVKFRTGIFFKALANFQFDKLLQTDIVSTGYLDGCYMLGQEYPELCASIFLLCERGHGVAKPSNKP